MKHISDIIAPVRGYPTLSQVTNCVKYLRKLKGTKNSIHVLKQMMRDHAFNPTGDLNKAFFFGGREDEEGYAYVRKGTDDDSFVIGVTNRALVNATIEYASPSRFTLFHADATFKLSDVSYPVVTCGFSDTTRSYQLAAIFVVSRRTAVEYAMCLSALTRIVKQDRPTAVLHIDAVMGDAEDAQLNGFQQVAEFTSATYLMCFFHVLYNVRKRTRHLSPVLRKAVTDGIMRIHYAADMNVYYVEKDDVLTQWKAIPQLESFVVYFTSQWIDSRYCRWQIFHTPSGYATTNNPCETFNALLKRYSGRRRYHMQRLLGVSQVVVQDATKRTPVPETHIQQPAPFMARAASSMIGMGHVVVHATDNPSLCRVKQLRKDEVVEAEELEALCSVLDGPFQAMTEVEDDTLILGSALLVREQRTRAAQLYNSVVTWSLWYAHISSMPEGGWIVDVEKCVCGCKFYSKHKTCCHVIVGRKEKKNLENPVQTT